MERIEEIVRQEIKKAINEKQEVLTEMAVPLKAYRARVDGLRFQLVENWCLCKWCQLFSPECNNFSHWATELIACVSNLKFIDIKNGIDKKRTLTKMLVDDYDYNKTNMITRIIIDKFDMERITDNMQIAKVASEFADSIQGLIDAISVDFIKIQSYMKSTFGI